MALQGPPTAADLNQARTSNDADGVLRMLAQLLRDVNLSSSKAIQRAQAVVKDTPLVLEVLAVFRQGEKAALPPSDATVLASKVLLGMANADACELYDTCSYELMPALLARQSFCPLRIFVLSCLTSLAGAPGNAESMLAEYPKLFPWLGRVIADDDYDVEPTPTYDGDDIDSVRAQAMQLVGVLLRPPANQQRLQRDLGPLFSTLADKLTHPYLAERASSSSSSFAFSSTPPLATIVLTVLRAVGDVGPPLGGVLTKHPLLLPRLMQAMRGADALVSSAAGRQDWRWKQSYELCMGVVAAVCRSNEAELAADTATLDFIIGKLPTLASSEIWGDDDGAEVSAQRYAFQVLLHVAKNRALAKQVFSNHHAVLLPVLHSMMEAPSSSGASLEALRILYYLSAPVANQPIMRSQNPLMATLERAAANESETYARAARISLLRAVDGQPALEFSPELNLWVYNLLREEGDGVTTTVPPPERVAIGLLALRYHAAVKENRADYWARFADDVQPLLPLVLQAMNKVMTMGEQYGALLAAATAAEDGLSTLVQFSADRGPRCALRLLLQTDAVSSRLVSDAGKASIAAESARKLLFMRLDVPEEEATVTTTAPGKTKSVADLVLVNYLHDKKWDVFLSRLPTSSNLAQLIGMAITLDAPMRVIKALLDTKRININEPNNWGSHLTPLLVALVKCEVNAAVGMPIALLLLEHGADGSYTNEVGHSALMISCQLPRLLPVTRKLVELGVDVNYASVQDNNLTALSMCITTQEGGQGCAQAQCLLEAGADVNQSFGDPHKRKFTPLFSALMSSNVPMTQLLLKHGADVTRSSEYATILLGADGFVMTEPVMLQLVDMLAAQEKATGGAAARSSAKSAHFLYCAYYITQWTDKGHGDSGFPRAMRRWLELGADVTTTIHPAAAYGNMGDVALFLQLGANPNKAFTISDKFAPSTPLMAAMGYHGSPSTQMEIVRLLIKAGADVNYDDGETLLAMAVKSGNVEMVQLLLQAGGAVKQRSDGDESLFQLAKRLGFTEMLPWLAADDGSDGVVALRPAEQFDEGGGFGFDFTLCAYCRRSSNDGVLCPCSGCIMVAYCNEECQAKHWTANHKPVCKKQREMKRKREESM